jgi:hypothetical protein
VVLTVLSLCDRTGIWSEPYARAGCRVIRVDLIDGLDVRLMDYPGRVWGIIAQPPCTHLAGSGARWWAAKGQPALLEALSVADACLRFVAVCRPVWWVLENPVGRLAKKIGPPAMTFNPCEYAGWADDPAAEAYTKRTCLWGQFVRPGPNPSRRRWGARCTCCRHPPSGRTCGARRRGGSRGRSLTRTVHNF